MGVDPVTKQFGMVEMIPVTQYDWESIDVQKKRDDGTYVSSGNYDAGKDNVNRIADLLGCRVSDQGDGHLYVQLPDKTELDYSRSGDFGILYVKRAGEAQVEIVFASAYKGIVVADAAGKDITDIDRLDGPTFDVFVEEKNGAGLLKVPEKKRPQAMAQFVQDQILDKGDKYVRITTQGVTVYKNAKYYVGSEKPPHDRLPEADPSPEV